MNTDSHYLAVGTYGSENSHNLRVLEITGHGRSVRQTAAVSGGVNPSFLAPSSDGKLLYVVNEINRREHGSTGTLKTFRIDPQSRNLEFVSETETFGDDPCFIAESPDGSFLAVANSGSGSVVLLRLNEDGIPEGKEPLQKIQLMGFGPVRRRQDRSHPQGAVFSPDGTFLYIPDLGADRVWIYHHSHDGRFRSADIPAAVLPPGSGPRSLVFDASSHTVFCLNELSSTLVQFRYDPRNGMLHPQKRVSTVPEGENGPNLAGEVHLHNLIIAVSNRGQDTLMLLKYDDAGFSHDVSWGKSGGAIPRSFCFVEDDSEEGVLLAVANRESDSVILFDSAALDLWPLRELRIPKPSCIRQIPSAVQEEDPRK